MEEGPNVDVVLKNPYDWDAIESDSFDLVISGQAFEHIEFFWKTMEEMTRVLKKRWSFMFNCTKWVWRT